MKSFTTGEGKVAIDRPTVVGIELEAHTRLHGLGDGESGVLDTPRADVLGQSSDLNLLAELVLKASVGRGGKEFADLRPEEQIASSVAGDDRGPGPRPAEDKL